MDGKKLPGTYRVEDRSPAPFSAARDVWAELAHEELREVAHRYHAVTTYKELAEKVQERSDVRTRVLLTNWIGKLLEDLATLAKVAGEPPLTALCVRQDGTIGPGYAHLPRRVSRPIWGATLNFMQPSIGCSAISGMPSISPRVAAFRPSRKLFGYGGRQKLPRGLLRQLKFAIAVSRHCLRQESATTVPRKSSTCPRERARAHLPTFKIT